MFHFLNFSKSNKKELKKADSFRSTFQMQKGFTLIEMIIVIAIFAVISTIVLFQSRNQKNNASVNNVAQDIALTIRRAQVFTLGLKPDQSRAALPFGMSIAGYGVHFDASDPKSFILFADIDSTGVLGGSPSNKKYDASGGCGFIAHPPVPPTECVEKIKIDTFDRLYRYCVDSGPCQLFNETPTNPELGSFDVVFTRPDPDASFCGNVNDCNSSTLFKTASTVSIEAISPGNMRKRIVIYPTGLISTESMP